jgi:hypothetical protein
VREYAFGIYQRLGAAERDKPYLRC